MLENENLDKISNFLESKKMLMVSAFGAFFSLVFYLKDISVFYDPGWISIIISGSPIFLSALRQLFLRKKISSALLITIAIIASISIGEIFAAAEIAFIMAVGEMLEAMTIDKSKKGLKKVINLAPSSGRVISTKEGEDVEEQIVAEKIQKGDILRVKPGESIPVDGVIVNGSTSIDQSIMTGESLPIDKTKGDSVFCGTINCFGSIDIKATKVGKDSSFEKLIKLLKEAQKKKAPTQRIVDVWASYLVPTALLISIITYFFTGEIERAVTILVVFCPCALVLATPTSIVAAIGQATKFGVIVKSGEALERMGKANIVAFDKTGTLTHAKLEVSDILPFGMSEDKLLHVSLSVESLSEHPLAKAIVKHAKEKEIKPSEVKNFKMVAGQGVMGEVLGKKLLLGTEEFLEKNGVKIENLESIEGFREEGKALVLVAMDLKFVGIFALKDTIREESLGVIEKLTKMGVKIVLLTGDSQRAAKSFAKRVNIKEVLADLLPEQKLSTIKKLQDEKKLVAMVGDGVNDAPALKSADVGIAMANIGSDIATEAADIVLMGDQIARVPYLKQLSNATIFSIKFNIFLSMFINILAVILSVMGILTPVTGALVHNASSVLVVLNAARLYEKKFDE